MTDYYTLRIYVEPEFLETRRFYEKLAETAAQEEKPGSSRFFDAGVDLANPTMQDIPAQSRGFKLDHQISCSMETSTGQPVCYYLYCRSSTGSKTPLRLANSVGIIDSGYRGHITGVFDHVGYNTYTVNPGERLLQICGPTLDRPIRVVVVNSKADLSAPTTRGDNGFGSTGR